jgi:hypothetical protein
VKLGDKSPSAPELFAAANNSVDSMFYCVGDQQICSQSSSFKSMIRVTASDGMTVFKSSERINLVNMMKITVWANSKAGDLKRTVSIRRK